MIRFSMEVPTAYLERWKTWTDLDFVLAHKVLEDKEYAEFFRCRPVHRELILDNSMHELGYPLSVSSLLEAANRCRADYIIAPDRLGEPEKNFAWFLETTTVVNEQNRLSGSRFRVGVVLCGRTSEERRRYLLNVSRDARMILLPYREPRLLWYLEHHAMIDTLFPRVHLLGVSELEELRLFTAATRDTDLGQQWSVDTAKPVKHAVAGHRLDVLPTLRGGQLSSHALLNLKNLTPLQEELVHTNVVMLQAICSGAEPNA